MQKWELQLNFEKNSVNFDFVDIRDILGSIVVLDEKVFKRLLEIALANEHYTLSFNAINIVPPEKVSFYPEQYTLIFATDRMNLKYGLLLILFPEKIILAGLWPIGLVNAIREDKDALEALLQTLIERPEYWSEVLIIMHNNVKDILMNNKPFGS